MGEVGEGESGECAVGGVGEVEMGGAYNEQDEC